MKRGGSFSPLSFSPASFFSLGVVRAASWERGKEGEGEKEKEKGEEGR